MHLFFSFIFLFVCLFFSVSLLVSLFPLVFLKWISPLIFFFKLEWASHANNCPFLLILLFGTGFHDKVVHEKELVESFHGCSVKRLCDYRADIVDFHTRCDPTV